MMSLEAQEFYDELRGDYDLMVSWQERLAREQPFFRHLFPAHGVRRVLDAACGTGMHAMAFARMGLEVAAADISPAMVAEARRHAAEAGLGVEAAVAAFGSLAAGFPGRSFDAVTCLGNSLPHVADQGALEATLADMRSLLRPGGVLVVQNRNYDRLLRDRQRFMPIVARGAPGDETLFLRITDFLDGDHLAFTMLRLRSAAGSWSCEAMTTPLRAIRREGLEQALRRAGFPDVVFFGGYGREPFDAPGTADLVAVATCA